MTPLPDTPAELRGLTNLEAVLRWAPALDGIDSVQMDEYNYDVLVPLAAGRWAVFGVS